MPHPGIGFPIPPFEWPHVGRQWPPYNLESRQAVGLEGWWPTLASRGAGVLRDLSGHGHDGTLQNLATWSSPYIIHPELGWMIDYPANTGNRYVLIPGSIVSNDTLSVSLWFITDEIDVYRAIFSIYTADNDSFEIFVDHGQARLFGGSYDSQALTSVGSIATGVLYHVALVSDGTNVQFYLNGLPNGTSNTTAFSTFTAAGAIGARAGGAGDYEFNGRIGGVRINNHAFTTADAWQVYDNLWGLHQLLRPLWRLGVVAPPPPTATLPIFPPPDAVHSLVFGGVTVR